MMQCIVKNRIGDINVHSKLTVIVFQINTISLIETEEFGETLIKSCAIRSLLKGL